MEPSIRTPLARLLRPKSVVVIGGREAEKCLVECQRIGYQGRLYAVNPKRDEMAGISCQRSVNDLPEAPDAAFICIPAEATIETVGDLSRMGAGGAVCYASGFAETGEAGTSRQERLLAAAGDLGLLGPNCYGIVNCLDGVTLWPDDHGGRRVDRGVAIISQSGNVAISLSMQDRGLPLAQLVAVGNQAKDGVPELIEALLLDERITAIGLFIETMRDVPAMAAAAQKAAQQGVPIVALKNGRTDKAASIALSHTSSMTGSDTVFDAFRDRYGIARVDSLPAFLETLKLLHMFPDIAGRRLLSMSCSGGEAGLVADLAARCGVETPPLSAERAAALNAVLGDKVTIDNPLDYHTYIWGLEGPMRDCFTEMLRADADAAMLLIDTPNRADLPLFGWKEAEAAIVDAAQETGRPTMVVSTLPESMPADMRDRLMTAGLAPMQGLEEAMTAFAAAAWIADRRKMAKTAQPPLVTPQVSDAKSVLVDEWRAKKTLAASGLSVPEGALVSSETEAVAAAEALGYPVVVKACSSDLAHKTEAGGVALNLSDADAVANAITKMEHLSDHFIVETMATGGVAELILGITRDAQAGLCLMIGAGGILAELIEDRALLLLPADRSAVERALDGLKVTCLLRGFRGKAVGDFDAVVDAACALARYAEEHADRLLELDVNPLIVMPQGKGTIAADALIRLVEE